MTNNNHIVLITGSSSGLGNQLTRTLLANGATVIASMRNLTGKNANAASALTDYAANQPGTLQLVELDVTDDESVQTAIENALAQHGHIDIVINNAGIGGGGLTEAFSVEQFRQTFDVNVLGVQRVMRAVLPSMRERGSGLIVNVSSAMGRIVLPFSGAYTASKYAVEGLSETYRYELVNSGVDVVIAEPGGFTTNYWTGMMQPGDGERAASYGDLADVPADFWNGVAGMLQSAEAANPAGFADAIVDLINTPSGERPLRLVIDPVTGGDAPKAINQASQQVQRQVLAAFGLNDFIAALPQDN